MINQKNTHLAKFALTMAFLLLWGCAKEQVDSHPPDANRVIPRKEYSRDKPGEWAGLEDEHLPKISFQNSKIGRQIVVTVRLPNASEQHYIEKIGMMNAQRNDIEGKAFTRAEKYFEARFLVNSKNMAKGVRVYAKCNLHDLWVTDLN